MACLHPLPKLCPNEEQLGLVHSNVTKEIVAASSAHEQSKSYLCWMQALYRVSVELCLDSYGPSDQVTERFGVREVRSVIDQDLSGHIFHVNGIKVHSPLTVADVLLPSYQHMAHDVKPLPFHWRLGEEYKGAADSSAGIH